LSATGADSGVMCRRRVLTTLPALAIGARAGAIIAGLGGSLAARAEAAGFDIGFDGYYEAGGSRTPLASARLRFEPAGDAYRMSLDVDSLLADLHYESVGRLDANGLHPEHYVERRHLPFGRKRRREARFVPVGANGAGPAGPGTLAVPDGTQDRISLIGQLWQLATRPGSPFEDGRRFELALASVSKVRPVVLQVDPAALLAIGDRQYRARRVRRVDEPGDDDELGIEIWLSARERKLPLAIRFIEPDRALHFEATAPGA